MSCDHRRPAIHFTPPRNWMNDPCGLFCHDGVYHLFYQHNPGANEWGEIHWGHAASRDLLHWHDRSLALAPDAVRGMPFTGSCVVTPDGKVAALFTGALPGETGVGSFQQQCLATTDDGEVWQHEGVVITNPGRADFRDPKVGRHPKTGEWYLVLAAGDEVIFYSSANLRDWREESTFGRGMGYAAGEWECPDLFRLPHPDAKETDDVWVLVVHEGRGLSPRHAGAQYILGDFDGRVFSPRDEDFRPVDGGHDFYAAQTWSNTAGRTVWIAWAAHWAYADTPTAAEWSGVLTLPREVSLLPDASARSGLRLGQRPVREVGALDETPLAGSRAGASDSVHRFHPTPGAPIRARLAATSERPFAATITLLFEGDARLPVAWDGESVEIDRRECLPGTGKIPGDRWDAVKRWQLPVGPERLAELELFFDRSILEVFAAGGAATTTDLVFPPGPLSAVEVRTSAGLTVEVMALPETMGRS